MTGAVSPIAINTGAALVDGIPYENTTSATLAIGTPAIGTTGHRIVLRANWAAQTVRITDIASADGTAAIPAAVQIAGTTYDITLATLQITTGGVITVTDARSFLHYTTRVNTAMLDDESVTAAKTANRTRTIFVSPRSSYNVTDSVALTDSTGNGLTMPDNKLCTVGGAVSRPADFVTLTSITPIFIAAASGNAYLQSIGNHGTLGQNPTLISEVVGYTATAATVNLLGGGPALALAAPTWLANEYLQIYFWRDATNVLDTCSGAIYFLGWQVAYTADG